MFSSDNPLEKELLKSEPPVVDSTNLNAPQSVTPPTQQGSPLDNLRDIHLPNEIDSFPSAIGWWILLALIIFVIIFAIFNWLNKHKALRYLRTAKLELNLLSQNEANHQSISELSSLLKRVCLIYYPSKDVASLSGNKWWEFVNKEAQAVIYSKDDINLMAQFRYQKDKVITQNQWSDLIQKTEKTMTLVIGKNIKNKLTKREKFNVSNGEAQ